MSLSEVRLLSSLAVTPRQVALVADMSEEVAPFWQGYFKSDRITYTYLDEPAASMAGLQIIVEGLLREMQNHEPLPAMTEPIFNIYLEYCDFMRGFVDSEYGVSFVDLSMSLEQILFFIKTQILAAEHLSNGLDKAIYLFNILPNTLNGSPFGDMAARMYSAAALIQCGYFPAPLMPETYSRTVQMSKPCASTSRILTGEFIDCYRRATRKILGTESRIITLIDKQVSSKAIKVFGDPTVVMRWLNKPAKRYCNISPRDAARTGYLNEVLEQLIGIDQGFLG